MEPTSPNIPPAINTGEQSTTREITHYRARSLVAYLGTPLITFKTNLRKNPFTTAIVFIPVALIFKFFTITIFFHGPITAVVLLVLDIWHMPVLILKLVMWVPALLFRVLSIHKGLYLIFSAAIWAFVGIVLLSAANKLTQFISGWLQRGGNISQGPERTVEQAAKPSNTRHDILSLCFWILRSVRDGLLVLLSSAQELLSYLDHILNASSGNPVRDPAETSRAKED